MPKKSEGTGATFEGHEGIVQDAAQQLWEVDPSRNLDGTVREGFESEDRDISSPANPEVPGGPDHDLAVSETDDLGQEKSRAEKREASDAPPVEEKEEKSSGGNSSPESSATRASSARKTNAK